MTVDEKALRADLKALYDEVPCNPIMVRRREGEGGQRKSRHGQKRFSNVLQGDWSVALPLSFPFSFPLSLSLCATVLSVCV